MQSNADTSSASELDIRTLLQLIPDFNTDQTSQVYRFIRSADAAFEIAQNNQIPVLLIYSLNKITGPGSSDVHSKQFHSWQELKSYLIEKFLQTKTLSHLNLELQSMFQRPNESVTDYFHRVDLCRSKIIEKISTEITDATLLGRKTATEEMALGVFVNGLISDIGTMLRTKEFNNLSDAGHFAICEDKIRSMNNARNSLYKINSSTQQRLPPQVTNSPMPSQTMHAHRVPIDQNRPTFRPNDKTCNYCKKPGHLISECRKRAYNNSMRAPQEPQRVPPATSAKINNLNSQATSVEGTTEDIAYQSPDLSFDLNSLQLQ